MSAELKSFPQSEIEALALEYVRAQDLSGLSPTQIFEMYDTAYAEIRKACYKKYPQMFSR